MDKDYCGTEKVRLNEEYTEINFSLYEEVKAWLDATQKPIESYPLIYLRMSTVNIAYNRYYVKDGTLKHYREFTKDKNKSGDFLEELKIWMMEFDSADDNIRSFIDDYEPTVDGKSSQAFENIKQMLFSHSTEVLDWLDILYRFIKDKKDEENDCRN